MGSFSTRHGEVFFFTPQNIFLTSLLTFKIYYLNYFLRGSEVKVSQSYLTLCDPVNYNLSGSSVLGILQARMLKWVAIPFFRGSSQPRDWTQVSYIAGRFFTVWATRQPKNTGVGSLSLLQGIFLTQNRNRVSCIAGGFFTSWTTRKAHFLRQVCILSITRVPDVVHWEVPGFFQLLSTQWGRNLSVREGFSKYPLQDTVRQ